jgi:membrane associated rhomboid family serine protease
MVSAAVGYQCPDCVKKGSKASRTGRGPFGGLLSSDPTVSSVTLIGINVVVFLSITICTYLARLNLSSWLALSLQGQCNVIGDPTHYYPTASTAAMCAMTDDGVFVPGFLNGAYWQPITSMFAHEGFLHLAFNMLALWFLGPQLERIVGRGRFLALYLLSGLAGSAAILWLAGPTTSTLGASGAVFGLMGGLLVIALKLKADVRSILFWVGINVIFTVANYQSGISWQGHLGGLVGGLVIGAILAYTTTISRTYGTAAPRERQQIIYLTAFGALILAALVLRLFI